MKTDRKSHLRDDVLQVVLDMQPRDMLSLAQIIAKVRENSPSIARVVSHGAVNQALKSIEVHEGLIFEVLLTESDWNSQHSRWRWVRIPDMTNDEALHRGEVVGSYAGLHQRFPR